MNKLSKQARELATSQMQFLQANAARLVIDADTHATDCDHLAQPFKDRYTERYEYYHGRPASATDLLAEMAMAGVDMSLIWQNPAATLYSDDKLANFASLRAANEYISSAARQYPTRFIPAGWTDPKNLGLELALELVDWCVLEMGFPIVKLNPAQNRFAIDSETVGTIVERIVSLGAVPAFHFGADTPFTPAGGLEKLARRFSSSPVVGIHMGGGGAGYVEAEEQYLETRAMGLRNPNIVFLLSARRDTHSESDFITYLAAEEPYSNNLCCASDAPYGRMSFNFGGFRSMLNSLTDRRNHPDPRIRSGEVVFSEEVVQGFLGGNFARLAVAAYKNVLKINSEPA